MMSEKITLYREADQQTVEVDADPHAIALAMVQGFRQQQQTEQEGK